ncbi:hypothetical protein GF377_08115, partial [candidate division GN15 bacterium]|nr:hypothetical protein [candidate division GN15 bacterium]
MTKLFALLLTVTMILAVGLIGCSDDDESPTSPGGGDSGGDTLSLTLVDVAEVIRDVAPPEFSAPTSAPAIDSFEIWTQGDWPLLDYVFGTEEPQTLYRNVDEFEFWMDMLPRVVSVDENGDPILGTFYDTMDVEDHGQTMTVYASATIAELTTATVMPTAFQDVLGTSYDLDYLVTMQVEHIPDGVVKVGITMDSLEQVLLIYENGMAGNPGSSESSLKYAALDLTDSTFDFRGVIFSDDDAGMFNTSFIMTSEANSDFAYRMSWFSDDIPAPTYTMLGCIIGGGNKDSEFALKYRQYSPADSSEIDADMAYEQVFGPNYSEGTG